MATKPHLICLTAEEREQVERAVRSNKNSPRARVLLAASDGTERTDKQVAAQVGACLNTVGARAAAFCAARLGGRAPPW